MSAKTNMNKPELLKAYNALKNENETLKSEFQQLQTEFETVIKTLNDLHSVNTYSRNLLMANAGLVAKLNQFATTKQNAILNANWFTRGRIAKRSAKDLVNEIYKFIAEYTEMPRALAPKQDEPKHEGTVDETAEAE